MRIFLTGATGFIGSQLLVELLHGGHQVLGLTRSQAGAAAITQAGGEAFFGDIADPDSLTEGAQQCDAVVHTAFDHDFSHYVANCAKDGRVIETLGSALHGTDRPLIITSATAMGAKMAGEPAVEDYFDAGHQNPRVASELAGAALLERGVNVSVVRLSQIHDRRKQGLVTEMIRLARAQGVSAYVEDGSNRWSAAPLADTARLYRLALERQVPGARYHAVAEDGVAFRDIAAAIGTGLGIPLASLPKAAAAEHFGWLATFADKDMSASSRMTRQVLDWQPTGSGLLTDMKGMDYAAA
jgi:nucleoside-diphosphate-sugar epimerase